MVLSKEEVGKLLQEPGGADKLMRQLPEAMEGAWVLWTEGVPAAAGLLARGARQKDWARELNKRLGDRQLLHRALLAENFKMRKNAARLAGALGQTEDVPVLIQALDRENTRMVRPSQILALGALPCPESRAYLLQYQPAPPEEPGQEPHYLLEQEALKKALAAGTKQERHVFKDFPAEQTADLLCPEGLGQTLAQEARKAGLTVLKTRSSCVRVLVRQAGDLMKVRGWQEALLPVAAGFSYNPQTVAQLCREKILPLLLQAHEGEPPFRYRWELRGFRDRGGAARELSRTVDGGELESNPSDYEAEFRLSQRSGLCRLDVKLFTLEDTRFSYRRRVLPASIHPATAAGLMALAAPWLKENASVADPCCGSGTLLLERSMYGSCRLLTGVDISRQAIEAAKENFRAAGRKGRFLAADCTRWQPEEPCDEIISNLPFGNRVGTHESNRALYRALAERLPRWLKPGGIAVLYTMEIQLLQQCLATQPALELLQLTRTEAGGLKPGIFILCNAKEEKP